jgi:hypothetical protein
MGRWSDYFLDTHFADFWRQRLSDSSVRVLVIFGLGFDPRSLASLQLLNNLGLQDRVGYLALKIVNRPATGPSGVVTEKLAKENAQLLSELAACRVEGILEVETQDTEGHCIVGRRTLDALAGAKDILDKYTDVVVDISGMPRGMFFPLIAYLLRLADQHIFPNLHATVVEDPVLDAKISGREYGVADYLHTFRHHDEGRLVWLPVVGENEAVRLEKIHNKIKSACIEICPIVPFPASSLRRVDEIVVNHAEIFFEGLLIAPDNLLLCDERMPFDIYRKILEVEQYYRTRLGSVPEIGKVKTVVSPLSSKTLSLGMLLAATEQSLPICHVEPGTYDVEANEDGKLVGDSPWEPLEIWLAGEPYTI